MTDHEIDRLVSTIHEMAARFGAVFVPDDVKIIIFKRAREQGRRTIAAQQDGGVREAIAISRSDLEEIEIYLGGFMGTSSSYQEVEALRARLRACLEQ